MVPESLVLPGEMWKPIPGYEGSHEVSSLGRVWSEWRMAFKASHIDGNGYPFTCLQAGKARKGFRVHQLVARAFLGEHAPLVVNHKNGIKTDNRVENLEWVTQGQNKQHYEDHLREPSESDDVCRPAAKLDEQKVVEIRQRAMAGESSASLGRRFGVSAACIINVVKRRNWKHVA